MFTWPGLTDSNISKSEVFPVLKWPSGVYLTLVQWELHDKKRYYWLRLDIILMVSHKFLMSHNAIEIGIWWLTLSLNEPSKLYLVSVNLTEPMISKYLAGNNNFWFRYIKQKMGFCSSLRIFWKKEQFIWSYEKVAFTIMRSLKARVIIYISKLTIQIQNMTVFIYQKIFL